MPVIATVEAMSPDDYLAAEETSSVKREFLRGMVFAMPCHSNRHNAIGGNTLGSLHSQLRGKTCITFNSNTKVRIQLPDDTRFYYPDAMVVCQANAPSDHFQDQPVVVIEVLSESTRRADLGEKRDAYLTIPSLGVLLYVESDTPFVTVHRRRAAGGFAIEHHAGLDAVIPLPEIEAQLALADLYERVDFAS
jgi:Uma2 family endonuclease